MMKIMIAVLFVAMSGCASTDYNGVHTGSRFYDAKYAVERGVTDQAMVSECERQGRAVWSKTAGNSAFGAMNGVNAGRAYEHCIDVASFNRNRIIPK